MFSHVTLGVNDLVASKRLYSSILAILGHGLNAESDNYVGYGDPGVSGVNCIWLMKPFNGEPATAGNGVNVAFLASTRTHVDEFYSKAIELGAQCDGPPGVRKEIHENFYAAYVKDYDGNKILAVCHN